MAGSGCGGRRRDLSRPAGSAQGALSGFGILLAFAGTAHLAMAVNRLASLLAILTLLTYLFAYTPLKRKTPICTLVGALPGAMPLLIGWAAATGRLNLQSVNCSASSFFGSCLTLWPLRGLLRNHHMMIIS
jgi:heme O synthase-like polyprenyltransferase